MTTEQLSGLLELPIEKILDEKNFRVKTIDLTKNALNKFDAMFKVVGWIKKNASGSWDRVAKAKEEMERRAKEEEERKAKAKKVKKEPAAPVKQRTGRGLFGFGGGAAPAPNPPAAAINVPAPVVQALPQRRAPAVVPPAPVVAAVPKGDSRSASEVDSDEDPALQQALLASMGK